MQASGLQRQVVTGLVLEVSHNVEQNFRLKPASVQETVTITAETPIAETTTMTVGQVVNQKTVQEIPLNGRHFVDLALLAPGTVTPPQNGFLTAPLRGQGSFGVNTAGQREEMVNFMINGINLNDMVQNQITFQPSINTVQEFKIDNSTYSAQYGRSSGAIVNIATRSGSNNWHGEAFDFVRNDFFDARNFFNKTSVRQSPFKRNQFGANLGGPIIKNKTFFFFSYEGLRQRQGVTINSGVLSSTERAAAVAANNPAITKLLPLMPTFNSGTDAPGQAFFVGSATAPVDIDQWTGDVSHSFSEADRLHGYYAFQRDKRQEPTLQGNTLPGFGDTRQSRRQILTINETHVFNPHVVNEGRLGFNRIHITFTPNLQVDPTTFNINDGVTGAIGLPQISVSSVGLNFGGPAGFPQGRGDTTIVLSDTLTWLKGNHNLKFGGEARRFNNNNFAGDIGAFVFNTTAHFIAGTADRFQITPGSQPSRIFTTAVGAFAMDEWKVTPRLQLELGLRYDWIGTPVEAKGRFVIFDPATASLVRTSDIYGQSHSAEPRLGLVWDLFGDHKSVLRAGYGYAVDQPVTNAVTGLASNPPLASTLLFVGSSGSTIPITTAAASAAAAGISVFDINHAFRPAYVQSYNLNLQRELTPTLNMMVGYFGAKGTHLRVLRNLNQPLTIGGPKPFPSLSASSAISPGAALGASIPFVDSASNSNYNALWVTLNKRFSSGLQFSAQYTWSKALDYNSLSSGQGGGNGGFILQDTYNPRDSYGPSDFDVRHRFVFSPVYSLPFRGNRLIEGWQLGTIFQAQSGGPVNVVISSGSLTGVIRTVRPDLLAPVQMVRAINAQGNVTWFAGAAAGLTCTGVATPGCIFLAPTNHFGNMRRNSIVGPGFVNWDFSLIKNTKITERINHQFRLEAFNLLNHPNLGLPGSTGLNIVGASNLGIIQSTRFPVGDAGSSRQLQLAMKLQF